MTSREIELALTSGWGIFDRRRYLVVPNVSWGLYVHECDLLVLTPAGYAHEIEIKISVGDLKKDAGKRHRHESEKIKYLWFAAPLEMKEALLENAPAGAGCIGIEYGPGYNRCHILRDATPRAGTRKFSAHERYQLARLGCIRYWDARTTINQLLKEL